MTFWSLTAFSLDLGWILRDVWFYNMVMSSGDLLRPLRFYSCCLETKQRSPRRSRGQEEGFKTAITQREGCEMDEGGDGGGKREPVHGHSVVFRIRRQEWERATCRTSSGNDKTDSSRIPCDDQDSVMRSARWQRHCTQKACGFFVWFCLRQLEVRSSCFRSFTWKLNCKINVCLFTVNISICFSSAFHAVKLHFSAGVFSLVKYFLNSAVKWRSSSCCTEGNE